MVRVRRLPRGVVALLALFAVLGGLVLIPPPPAGATAGGDYFHPLAPARVLDSRDGTGGYNTPWTAGLTRTVTIGGGVPSSADAVVLSVTVTGATAASHLTIWAADQPRPQVSTMNFAAGQTVANQATVRVAPGARTISIFNNAGSVQVIADVFGYYDTSSIGGSYFHPLPASRILDSRTGLGGFSSTWGAGVSRTVTVSGGFVPATATAVALTVTATDATAPSFLTLWPAGETKPLASNINFVAGQNLSNAATVRVGTGANAGKVSIFNNAGTVNVIADVSGWYDGATGDLYHPLLTPQRVLDSRSGLGGYSTPFVPPANEYTTPPPIAIDAGGAVPANVDAVSVNLTALGGTAATFVELQPADIAKGNTTTVSFQAGQTIADAATVAVHTGTARMISLFTPTGSVHALLDVAGWFESVDRLAQIRPLDPSLDGAIIRGAIPDTYTISGNGTSGPMTITAPATNLFTGANRVGVWPASESTSLDQQSCADWTTWTWTFRQEGAVLRATNDGTTSRGIFVTKNVIFYGFGVINVHVWDTSANPPGYHLASFDMSSILYENGAPRAFPWHLCARAVGNVVTFVVWTGSNPFPGWDSANAKSTYVPTAWVTPGKAGVYAGHIQPNQWMTYENITTTALGASGGGSTQEYAATTASVPTPVAPDMVPGLP